MITVSPDSAAETTPNSMPSSPPEESAAAAAAPSAPVAEVCDSSALSGPSEASRQCGGGLDGGESR